MVALSKTMTSSESERLRWMDDVSERSRSFSSSACAHVRALSPSLLMAVLIFVVQAHSAGPVKMRQAYDIAPGENYRTKLVRGQARC